MKTRKYLIIILIMVTALSLIGCSPEDKTFITSDAAFETTVNGSFNDMSGQLNESAILEIGSDRQTKYFILLSYDSSYFDSLEEFGTYFLEYELPNLYSDYTLSEQTALESEFAQINKVPVKLTYDGDEMLLDIYFMQNNGVYLLGMGWCELTDAEKYEAQFDGIAAGLKAHIAEQ